MITKDYIATMMGVISFTVFMPASRFAAGQLIRLVTDQSLGSSCLLGYSLAAYQVVLNLGTHTHMHSKAVVAWYL